MNDLYDMYGGTETGDISDEMQRLEKKIHRLKKKKKKSGKHGKKKRLKKRIKQLEREQEQLKWLLFCCMQQGQMRMGRSQKQSGWQDTLSASLPGFFELATACVSKLPDRRNAVLCLPEKK